jgi:hypothetical protein
MRRQVRISGIGGGRAGSWAWVSILFMDQTSKSWLGDLDLQSAIALVSLAFEDFPLVGIADRALST